MLRCAYSCLADRSLPSSLLSDRSFPTACPALPNLLCIYLRACACYGVQAATVVESLVGRAVPNLGFVYVNFNDHGFVKVREPRAARTLPVSAMGCSVS